MAATMPRRGWLLASPCLRKVLTLCGFANVDSSRLQTVCGQCEYLVAAVARTIEAAAFPRTRPVRGIVCLRGLSADTDSSRTWSICVCVLRATESQSWTSRVCGHPPITLRGCSACSSRLIRGRRSLAPARGKACPVLSMMRNAVFALLPQLLAPMFQLCSNDLNAAGLLDCG